MSKINPLDKVTYVGSDGLARPALVVATRKSLSKEGTVTLEKGHVNVQVFSPSGKIYFKSNIPTQKTADAKGITSRYVIAAGAEEAAEVETEVEFF